VLILGRKINVIDFIPPVITRIVRNMALHYNLIKIIPPFDRIPRAMRPRWLIDVGANHGDVSRAALESFPECKAICFEPVSGTFAILKNNLSKYKDRVFFYNKALSNTNGFTEINLTSFDGANSICAQTNFHKTFNPQVREVGKEKIEMIRLDDIAKQLPAQKIDVLKIDVEGFEIQVLQGGSNFIKNNVDTILIEVSLQRDNNWENQAYLSLFNIMNDFGFRLINIYGLYNSTNTETSSNMLLTQFDCVFRHKRCLA
jgi:FkbM family methyltransferase